MPKTKTPSIVVTAKVPKKLHADFHKAAEKDHRSASAVLRILMEEYVNRKKGQCRV